MMDYQKLFGELQPVTHEEARNAATDLINHYFKNEPRKDGGVLISIPARADNTDLVLMRYIQEQSEEQGFIVANGAGDRWRTWDQGNPAWTDDRDKATRYHRREDAEAVHAEDEDAWRIEPFASAA